jgi:hypothetical protein
MAEGLSIPPITQREFIGADFDIAERIARTLGYKQTAYTSTSALWGLFCLPENPREYGAGYVAQRRNLPPFTDGCIIKTREFGFMFVQTCEDLGLDDDGRRRS